MLFQFELVVTRSRFGERVLLPKLATDPEPSLRLLTITHRILLTAASALTRSSRLCSSRRSLCRALICIAIEMIMMTKEMTKTAIAARSAISFASDNGIGACVARKIPNQLAPTSAKKRDTRSHPSKSRLIRRRCRQDFFAAASSASSWSVKCAPRRLNVPRRTNGCLNSFRSGPLDNWLRNLGLWPTYVISSDIRKAR
jgi:hypothetical protein